MPPGIYKRKPRPFRERFEKKIGDMTDCWEWIGTKSATGYGQFFMQGKLEQAHRASWKIYNGKIPKGKCVCHGCDNRLCVNPYHLWLGTQADNVKDMMEKGRGIKASSENNGGVKLSWAEVDAIRNLYPQMKSHRKLAKQFRISRRQISRIVRNLSWKV